MHRRLFRGTIITQRNVSKFLSLVYTIKYISSNFSFRIKPLFTALNIVQKRWTRWKLDREREPVLIIVAIYGYTFVRPSRTGKNISFHVPKRGLLTISAIRVTTSRFFSRSGQFLAEDVTLCNRHTRRSIRVNLLAISMLRAFYVKLFLRIYDLFICFIPPLINPPISFLPLFNLFFDR